MKRHELIDRIEEIQQNNYSKFMGSNEADLMVREEVADLFEAEQKRLTAIFKQFSDRDEKLISDLQERLDRAESYISEMQGNYKK